MTGAEVSSEKVVRDGKIITAAGMGVALAFGAELVSIFYGAETANKIMKSVIAV